MPTSHNPVKPDARGAVEGVPSAPERAATQHLRWRDVNYGGVIFLVGSYHSRDGAVGHGHLASSMDGDRCKQNVKQLPSHLPKQTRSCRDAPPLAARLPGAAFAE